MAGKSGKLALVKVSGTAASFTAEACTNTVTNLEYQVTDSAKRVFDRTATITVLVAAVPVSATTYTLNRLTGTVIFTSSAVRTVTMTGSYLPMSTAAEAKQYSYGVNKTLLSDAIFGDTWDTKVSGLAMVQGSLSRWRSTDAYFTDALVAGLPVVIEFWSDTTSALDFKIWALLDSAGVQAAVAGMVEESVAFQSTTDSDGRSISS